MHVLVPEAGWTHRRDSDKKREHDFRNLLAEYTLAVGLDLDQQLIEFLGGELVRAYRESRCACGLRKEQPRQT